MDETGRTAERDSSEGKIENSFSRKRGFRKKLKKLRKNNEEEEKERMY